MSERLKVGVIVNPVAGIGGPTGLKGSDGARIQALAEARGAIAKSGLRMTETLSTCRDADVEWLSWGGSMGADVFAALGIPAHCAGSPADPSGADDTRTAAQALVEAGADLILFAGGDGTAGDLFDAVGSRIPVLGVPTGVKMHSGVFTVTPKDAAEVVRRLATGGLIESVAAEVRDVDEDALRKGRVATRHHGELRVPALGGYLQHTKSGGREDEQLALTEIVEEVAERIVAAGPDTSVILGPGSNVQAVGARLGFETTLLGFDVVRGDELIHVDADSRILDAVVDATTIVVMSFGREQGILFGRGNQQLSATALARLSRAQLWVVATRSKLASLDGRPLRVDTGDAACDQRWAGLIDVITGYQDSCLHRVSAS